MRIELSKLDFEIVGEALRLWLTANANDADFPARELDRGVVLRDRFHNAFTGWLDMDGND